MSAKKLRENVFALVRFLQTNVWGASFQEHGFEMGDTSEVPHSRLEEILSNEDVQQGLKERINAILDFSSERRFDLERFFKEVGNGVVKAQRYLDIESRDYLQHREPHTPASTFRIPKASAEFQFKVDQSSESGFNILIAKDEERTSSQQTQRVSFDVVAVPPPPDYQAEAAAQLDYADSSERRVARLVLERIRDKHQQERVKAEPALEHFRDTTVLRLPNARFKPRDGGADRLGPLEMAAGSPALFVYPANTQADRSRRLL